MNSTTPSIIIIPAHWMISNGCFSQTILRMTAVNGSIHLSSAVSCGSIYFTLSRYRKKASAVPTMITNMS